MSDLESQVRRLIGIYQSSVFDRDVDAFMQLYDPDVRIFDTWGVWSQDGAERWRASIEGWFASLRDERCRVTFDEVRIMVWDGVASMTAFVKYEGLSAQGAPLRAMDNRISWVLHLRRNVLRIVHEHTSVPVGFEDAKGMLER